MTYVCLKTKYTDSIYDELETGEKFQFNDDDIGIGCSTTPGDDSSYDSDYEAGEEPIHIRHYDVSRTVSDTLGQEFSEYVSNDQQQLKHQPINSTYQSRLEFALKLGYTEKLVQAALQKLGPNPEENELLAELIKLGTHQQLACLKLKNNSFDGCDNVDELTEQISLVSSDRNKLRPIVIDGSNVAMSHGNKEVFSCRGIKICVDWFRSHGHTKITVFVPKWRKETPRPDNPVIDQEILHELERERLLVFTPSREVGGKRMVCYDDRYILKLAADDEGIVVSNDNYRDLIQECPEFRKVVEERILMYSFVNDRFMPPDDPLGRSGPTLDNFLKMPAFCKGGTCPYGKKCTYGNKCKYNHPERGVGPQKSITERLAESAQKQLLARNLDPTAAKKLRGKSLSLPLQPSSTCDEAKSVVNAAFAYCKQPLSRTKSTTLNCKSAEAGRDLLGRMPTAASHLPPSTQASTSPYYCMLYQMNHLPPRGSATDRAVAAAVENDLSAENMHRKLQRQLSINPTCDPRIHQPPQRRHMPASRHYSYHDQSNYLSPHSNVTRISSAPPTNTSPYSIASECCHVSSSEPQLSCGRPATNFGAVSSSLWSVPGTATGNYVVMPRTVEQTRCRLRYHLASIFPEEQVDAAMRYYPSETNPQKICAAILSMFPK